jgi:hypothetical protein
LLPHVIRLVRLCHHRWETSPRPRLLGAVPAFANKKLERETRVLAELEGQIVKTTLRPKSRHYRPFVESIITTRGDEEDPAHPELPDYLEVAFGWPEGPGAWISMEGEDDRRQGYPYVRLVMRVHGRMRMPEVEELGQAVRDVLFGLRQAHANGLVHGDLRWHNVVSYDHGGDGRCSWTLIDFENGEDLDEDGARQDFYGVLRMIAEYAGAWEAGFVRSGLLARVAFELGYAPLAYLEGEAFGVLLESLVA